MDKLTIVRKFTNTRQQHIPADDYPAFKSFFEKIIKAENKFDQVLGSFVTTALSSGFLSSGIVVNSFI